MAQASARILLSAAGATAAMAAFLTLLLIVNGELYTTSAGVRAQFASNGLYGRSIWDDFFAYKLLAFETRPTASISVGSSRAMPIRAVLFRDLDHFSAGGAVNSIAEFEAFVAEFAKLTRPPKVVFLYVDFEWFLSKAGRERNAAYRDRYESWLFIYQSAFVHLRDLLANAFAARLTSDPETGGRLIGSRAQRTGSGFRTDGSIRQPSPVDGAMSWQSDFTALTENPDGQAAREDARTFTTNREWWGATLDGGKIARFDIALRSLESPRVSVVLILPPLAPHIAAALQERPQLQFFRDGRQRLSEIAMRDGVPYFDFTRVPLRSPSCYFDRYHGSEGAYAWMLSTMQPVLASQHSPAAEVFDADALAHYASPDCVRALPVPPRVERDRP